MEKRILGARLYGVLVGYQGSKHKKKSFIRNHDIIFYYVKSEKYVFNKEYIPYAPNYLRRDGSKPTGKGIPLEDTWNCHDGDILDSIMIKSFSQEKLGYPTQKPMALLERITRASSNEGDVVLDPFCGCATTCIASEKFNRKWIGIDISDKAFYMVYYRLKTGAKGIQEQDVQVQEKSKRKTLQGIMFNENIYMEKEKIYRTDISEGEQIEKESNLLASIEDKKNIKEKNKKMTAEEKEFYKELLYEEQNGRCNGCDKFEQRIYLTIDHIKPKSKGGTDNYENLQLLCFLCNNIKRTQDMKFLFDALFKHNVISKDFYEIKIQNIKIKNQN